MGNQVIELEAGEFATGNLSAAQELGIPKTTVCRNVKTLQDLSMVERKAGSKQTIIKVVKWEDYQGALNGSGTEVGNKWDTSGKQTGSKWEQTRM